MTEILDSRYRVGEEIGSGGMGKVYKAVDTRLNVPVAVKFIVPKNEDAAIGFYREAEFLSNLSHPALPRVMDFNRNDENQYLVMEYIEGDDLKTQLEKRQAPFSADEVMIWATQLLDVLGYLHNQGIQHRDIKPANIKVRGNRVFLLDFGIASGQVGEMSTMSSRSRFWRAGTFEFSSLEQLKGVKTNPSSDIYSLAATLYLLLSGILPENPDNRLEALALRKKDPLLNLRYLVPSLKQNVAEAIMSGLELEANNRPQSAAQMYQKMFPAKPAKQPRNVLKKLAFAAGLPSLLLSGAFFGANFQQISEAFAVKKVSPVEQPQTVSPHEEAVALTEDALILLQSAKYDEAMKKCGEALEKSPNYPYAHFVCGDAIWDSYYDDVESNAEMTRVQKHADEILKTVVSPQTAEEYVSRAWANLCKEKLDVAVADATKALELKPDYAAALMIRASARSSTDDKQILLAFDDYNKVVELMPNYVQARANRASSYYSLGKYDWAISDYTEAIRVLPVARYFNGRGNAYYALQKYREARTEYTEAIKRNPKYVSAQTGIADTFMQEEDWTNAVKNYTKAIALKPEMWSYRNRGYANGELGKIDKALKDFNEALKIDDTDYLTYFYRGQAFIQKRELKKAVSDFSQAIEKTPKEERENLAELYRYRSMVYREIGEENKAQSDEKKAETLGV